MATERKFIVASAPSQFNDEIKARFGIMPDPPVGEYTKAFQEWLDSRLMAGIKAIEENANESAE